jgi:hypothetical protein
MKRSHLVYAMIVLLLSIGAVNCGGRLPCLMRMGKPDRRLGHLPCRKNLNQLEN